jgi:hypothetical protein
MSKRERPLDLEALLDAWPGARPSAGFADRVLAACDLQPAVAVAAAAAPSPVIAMKRPARAAAPPSTRRAFLAGAVLAAAFVLVPLFVYRSARSSPPSVITAAVSPDLGFERD